MKKLINKLLVFVLLLCVGCQAEKDYELPIDIAWTSYCSITNDEINEADLKVAAGDYIFLRDASQGTLSHEWIIDENADFFTNIQDASSKIDGKVTTSKDAYVVFDKSGVTEITLRNTYPQKVVSNTNPQVESVYDESIGAWVYTKTIAVEVYGELKPAITVYKIGLDGVQTQLLEIAAEEQTSYDNLCDVSILQGEKLKFVYNPESDYKSDFQTYVAPSVAEAEGDDPSSGVFTFDQVTQEGKPLTGFSITASREAILVNSGKGEIPATTVKKLIPISLTVEYSPIAAILSGVKQTSDGTFVLPFNKQILSPLPAGIEDCFKFSDSGVEIGVSAVEIYEGNNLKLTVDNSEIANLNNYMRTNLKLSYSPTSVCNIFALEDIAQAYPVEAFRDVDAQLYHILNSSYFNFTQEPLVSTELVGGWWASYTSIKPSATNSLISYLESYNGQESVVCFDVKQAVENNATEQLILKLDEKLESGTTCQAGEYTLKCKIYVESVAGTSAKLDLMFGNWVRANLIELTTLSTNTWIDYSATFTTSSLAEVSGFMIQVKNGNFSDDASAKFYIDDIYIYKN